MHDLLVKERIFGLTLFCESLVANPFLRSDSRWISFIQPVAEQAEWKFASHEYEEGKNEWSSPPPRPPRPQEQHNNIGETMLHKFLQQVGSLSSSLGSEQVEELELEVTVMEPACMMI